MIISHKHQFIFLKTSKTAGTSIEIALSKFCGPDDIITPISAEDEKMRTELGYRGPQNYMSTDWGGGIQGVLGKLLKKEQPRKYYNHIKARKAKPLIGDQVWNDYYKFCFVRNPWDRVISQYYWRCKSEPRPSILEFLDRGGMKSLKRKSEGVYMINGTVVVDQICKFENIAEEMEEVRKQLGLPESLDLPRAKSATRKDKRNYREVLSEEEKEKISDFFADEIKRMNYEF